jgi:hypothetical protein
VHKLCAQDVCATPDLLLCDCHLIGDIGEHRRLYVETILAVSSATRDTFATFAFALVDERENFVHLRFVDLYVCQSSLHTSVHLRSLFDICLEWIADYASFCSCCTAFNELVVDSGVYPIMDENYVG